MTNNDLRGNWKLDLSHSELGFSVRHLMISKVKGSFQKFDGSLTVDVNDDGVITEASVQLNIDVSSINTNDEGRDGHLRSADFFDTDQYPTASFVSTGVSQTSKDEFELTGELTLKGITREEVLKVSVNGVAVDPYGNTKAAATATLKLNRTDYGLTWNTALETGGVLVGEEVTIIAELQAEKVA